MHRHPLVGAEFALGFYPIALGTDRQYEARLAMHQVLHQVHHRQASHATQPVQALNKARFQYRVKVGVDVDVRDGLDALQLVQGGHQVGQNRLRHVPGDQFHAASETVLVETAVAAILLRVLVAGTGIERIQGHAQDIGQGARIVGQQLVEIARAAGHRVIQHHEELARPAFLARLILQHHAQVVDLAAEPAFQAQLHRGHEGLHHPFVHTVLGVGHQYPQGLGLELPVQIQAFEQVGWGVIAMLGAVETVGLGVTLGIALGRLLHLAAVAA